MADHVETRLARQMSDQVQGVLNGAKGEGVMFQPKDSSVVCLAQIIPDILLKLAKASDRTRKGAVKKD
jgi:hypothetical protein